MVHVLLKPEEDDIDEDDNNVLEEPVHVKIPVGNYPSAEKAAHSTGWGESAHLDRVPAFEKIFKKLTSAVWQKSFVLSSFHFLTFTFIWDQIT